MVPVSSSREEPVGAGHTEVSLPLWRSTPTSDSCTGAGLRGGTGVRVGLPPALPEPPARSRKRYLPGAPGPGSPRPRAQSGRAAGFQLVLQSGRAARSADRRAGSPGAEGGPPATRAGGARRRARGRGPESGPPRPGEARAPAPLSPPRAHPAPSAPRPSASAAPVSRAGLRDARSQRYK